MSSTTSLTLLPFATFLLAASAGSSGPLGAQAAAKDVLTTEERAAGWRPLFDGKTLDGWRTYKRQAPDGWVVADGAIARGSGAGDLITKEEFGDFELALEWKISPGGNSGVFYRATEAAPAIHETAPEMQILDNARHKDGANSKTSAGANYALHAPSRDVTRPAGEWNEARIVARGPHVEHWLNGVKIVEYEAWSPEWEALVKASKFGKMPAYGRAKRGYIGLQDHGDAVWFRRIRIRPL